MQQAYLATIFEMNARGKPWNGPRTVFAFIGHDEGNTNFFAGQIMDDLHDRTGVTYSYSVQPLPYLRTGPAGAADEPALIEAARAEVAQL